MRHRTIEQLAGVASTYRNAVGDGRSPVDTIATDLGITYEAAKRRIYRARRAGLLAPIERGV